MFTHYLLTAYKVFMRRKLFTAINLLCIVLTLVVLMVVTALLEYAFYPAGVEGRSERFLQVHTIQSESPDGKSISRSPLGFKLIDTYLKPLKSVELVGMTSGQENVSVYQQGRVTELKMRHVDANYWKILDFTLLAGRLPLPEDDARGSAVAVINQATATKLFGTAPAVGQAISVSGQRLRVIGVVANESHVNSLADLWAPVTSMASSEYRNELTGSFTALLLARSPADLAQIRQDVVAVARTIRFDDPGKWSKSYIHADSKLDMFARMTVGSSDQEDSGAGMLLVVLVVAMLLFMLLPALNLVNLNSARILERSAEIGVRKAFGATSAQVTAQLVVENVLLCLAGGAIGLLCATGVLAWLEQSGLIEHMRVPVNFAVIGYGLVITIVFGLLSGVLPAWKTSRLDPVHALKGAI